MPMDVQARRLLTVKQVADRLGLSTKQVRRRIAAGDLPAIRLGPEPRAHVRVDPAELERYVYGDPAEVQR
jgi:excisionase family DNA binding protein